MDDYRELMDKLHLSSEKYFEIQKQIRRGQKSAAKRRWLKIALPLLLAAAAFLLLVKVTQQPFVADPPILQGAPAKEYQSLPQLEKAFGSKIKLSESLQNDFDLQKQRLVDGDIVELELKGAGNELTYRVGPQNQEIFGGLTTDREETVTLADGTQIYLILDDHHKYVGGYTDEAKQRYFVRGEPQADKAYYVKLLEIS